MNNGYINWSKTVILAIQNDSLENIRTYDLLTLLWNYELCHKSNKDKKYIFNELIKRKLRYSLWGGWGELLILLKLNKHNNLKEYMYVKKQVLFALKRKIDINNFHTYDFINGYAGNLHALIITKNLNKEIIPIINNNFIIPLIQILKNENICDFSFAHGLSGILWCLKEYYYLFKDKEVQEVIQLIRKYIYKFYDNLFFNLLHCNTRGLSNKNINKVNFSWCYGNLMLAFVVDTPRTIRYLSNNQYILEDKIRIWCKDRKMISCHGILGPLLFFYFQINYKDYINVLINCGVNKIKEFFQKFPEVNVISDNYDFPYSEFDGTTSTIMFLSMLDKSNDFKVAKAYASLFGWK